MTIEFRCTQCGKLLRTGEETAGKHAKCPDCGTVMTIPAAASPADVSVEPAPTGLPAAAPVAAGQSRRGGPVTLDFGSAFSRTWAIFKPRLGECVLLSLVPLLIGAAVMGGFYVFVFGVAAATRGGMISHLFSFLGSIVVGLIAAWIGVAMLRVFLKVARGQEASLGEAFVFDATVWSAVVTAFVFQLMLSVGFALCLVPGFFLLAMFLPCVALAVDRKLAVGDSFTAAMQMTEGNRMTLFLIWLVASLGAGVINSLTCSLGALVTVPFLVLLYAVIYLTLAGEPTAKQ